MEVAYFSTAWFITLFSCVFSCRVTMKCWNMLFLKGFPFLIQLSLAIFTVHKGNQSIPRSNDNYKFNRGYYDKRM